MDTLLDIVDFVVLLLLIVHITRTVWKEQLQGNGSLLLTICIALASAIFAIVSYTSYMGLVAVSSSLTRVIFLVFLLAMVVVVRLSWTSKPAG